MNPKTQLQNAVCFGDVRVDASLINRAERHLNKLQRRLFKAVSTNNVRLIKFISHLIKHSFYNFILSFHKVCRKNAGKKTAGVDKRKLKWAQSDIDLATKHLYQRSIKGKKKWKCKPLRRVEIPKPDGTKRPLGIPTHLDRIYQAILTPIIEALVENQVHTHSLHSYGFRKKVKVADAISALGITSLIGKHVVVLEADIEKCFDRITHHYILNALKDMPKDIISDIQNMLESGFVDIDGSLHETTQGTPQGGIISPALANLVLRKTVDIPIAEIGKVKGIGSINCVTYADDLVITIKPIKQNKQTQTHIDNALKLVIDTLDNNLAEAGLRLKLAKTKIVNYQKEGVGEIGGIKTSSEKTYNFLGFQLGVGTGIIPAKDKLDKHHQKVKILMQKGTLIKDINPVIRGFYNYYAHFSSGRMWKELRYLDYLNDRMVWKRKNQYSKADLEKLCKYGDVPKSTKYIAVTKGSSFLADPDYFAKRELQSWPNRKKKLYKLQSGKCPMCHKQLSLEDMNNKEVETHHVKAKGKGGKDKNKNVILIHKHCHILHHQNEVTETEKLRLINEQTSKPVKGENHG